MDKRYAGSYDTMQVDSVMFVKTPVFNGHESMSEILGNLFHAHGDPVGIACYQFGSLITFYIVNEG